MYKGRSPIPAENADITWHDNGKFNTLTYEQNGPKSQTRSTYTLCLGTGVNPSL